MCSATTFLVALNYSGRPFSTDPYVSFPQATPASNLNFMPRPTEDSESEEFFEEFLFDFDHADLKRFINRLPTIVEKGMGKTQTDQVLAAAKKLKKAQKSTLEFPVRYSGQDTRLVVSLYAMDDVAFPTLYIYALPELIAAIEEELSRFVETSPDED